MVNDGLLTAAPRIALALMFIFGAVNGFHYVATGEDMIVFPASQEARAFTDALKASGFFWPFMKGLDFIGGLSLLANFYAPIGFLLLVPIIATIILFQFTINPAGAGLGLILLVLSIWLALRYAPTYRKLFNHAR